MIGNRSRCHGNGSKWVHIAIVLVFAWAKMISLPCFSANDRSYTLRGLLSKFLKATLTMHLHLRFGCGQFYMPVQGGGLMPIRRFAIKIGALLVVALRSAAIPAQSTEQVTVHIDPSAPRVEAIPRDFAGMSYESQAMRSDYMGNILPGRSWLDGVPGPYSTMLQTLGIHHIRIGGNTSEEAGKYPTLADALHVSAFAHLIDANVIWGLPAESQIDVTQYTNFAKAMYVDKEKHRYKFQLAFAIGNEPDYNHVTPADYTVRFEQYFTALRGALGSKLKIVGPEAAYKTQYVTDLISLHGRDAGVFANITMHEYLDGAAGNYKKDTAAAIAAMLSSHNTETLQKFLAKDGWMDMALRAGFTPRITETNSMTGGGYTGANNTFAAALWALDYLGYLANETHVGGLDFHTSSGIGGYNPINPIGLKQDYMAEGVAYGLLAFHQYAHGRPVPLQQEPSLSNSHFSSYAVLQPDGSLGLCLINKSWKGAGTEGVDYQVTIASTRSFTHMETMYLKGTVTSNVGMSLGGKTISPLGTWDGRYMQGMGATADGSFTVIVPAASAAIVMLH